MNEINTKQNETASIDKLSAQHQLYSDAKNRLGMYLFLSIPVMILLNTAIKPAMLNDWMNLGWKFDLTELIALFALLLSSYELLFLKRYISDKKQKAAKIQEDFDCTVYDLEWNDLLCGSKECDLEIKKSSNKYLKKGKSRDTFNDWYTPDVTQLDNIKAIFVCQKESLGWDVEQRSKFNKFIFALTSVVFILSLLAGFYFEFTLKFLILSVIIPSWPAISFAVTSYNDNKEAIEDKNNLKIAAEKVEFMRVPTIKHARNIQNLIYLNRKNNCLIFNWFYKYLKDSSQEGVSYASRQLIQRLL